MSHIVERVAEFFDRFGTGLGKDPITRQLVETDFGQKVEFLTHRNSGMVEIEASGVMDGEFQVLSLKCVPGRHKNPPLIIGKFQSYCEGIIEEMDLSSEQANVLANHYFQLRP